ncbi:glycosyltransferase family 4 protein [Sphingobacterium chungjuense]|uniref:glycosyltransferase family 4 protein n=1 Tax=Sphingobacterium chungjuense TaxID=2675553 RepID=UPI001409F54B|nr:glycosyltransferase family 4 protein [Sphingobacterium chungjuense]
MSEILSNYGDLNEFMDKIGIVVQRYSEEVNGGAELHARQLAEHLQYKYEVEVLTTCAIDYVFWENYYPEGEDFVNGVKVIRFKTKDRNVKMHRRSSRYLRGHVRSNNSDKGSKNFLIQSYLKLRYRRRNEHEEIFSRWIDEMGPNCPGLITFLTKESKQYKAIVFFTFMYYPTVKGLPVVAEKSIFIPTAHDDPYFHMDGYKQIFSIPRFIMYNTLVEKELVQSAYPASKNIKSDVAGVGFDTSPRGIVAERPIKERYFVYIGRIDINKGCKELVSFFLKFRKNIREHVRLVMIGKNSMEEITVHPDIVYTGFISEEEKLVYLQYSEALVIPSPYESLSMVTLEAMALGKPVLATEESLVLKKHIELSKAGYIYKTNKNFCELLLKILNLQEQEKNVIATNGIEYVDKNYKWETIISKFEDAINYVSK